MEVTFDPRRISYAELLEVYWRSFPFQIDGGPSRTRNVVVPTSDRQARIAAEAKRVLGRRTGGAVHTELVDGGAFFPAERMHQKFDLQRMHPDLVATLAGEDGVDAFLHTPTASRLNAYVTGFADDDILARVAEDVDWPLEALRASLSGQARSE